MTTTTNRLTIAEYLYYNDGTDTRYELVNGELISMSLGTGKHGALIKFLAGTFDREIEQRGLNWTAISSVLGIQSPRGGRWDTVRIPDVVILPLEQWRNLQNREAVINLNEPPPLLVVEVVSESTKRIDYGAKQAEYSVLNIPEYWIVDPLQSKITVLTLIDEWYESADFTGSDVIQSTTFPNLQLTAEQILTGNL